MIDFENYERVTVRGNRVNNRIPLEQIKGIMTPLCDVYNRLAELEDLIEKGKLVPKYCIVKDYLGYNLCVQTTINVRCRDFYDNKEEAEKKLKELMESDKDD